MYENKKIIHIVAIGQNGEIGFNNNLLWHIPEDLKYFKSQTLGHACIAGRKTLQSFPSPLTRRAITTVGSLPGCYSTLDEALHIAKVNSDSLNTDCIYIIGGSSLYKQTEDIVDEALITVVDYPFPHADTYYSIPPNLDKKEASDYHIYKNLYPYCFTKWSV